MDKIKTCFERIELNTPIFPKVSFEPTLINFLYGKNGTGKTTISRCLKDGTAITAWNPDSDRDDVRLYVYDEDFIQDNVQSYGNIPGVFTITKQNAEAKRAVDDITKQIADIKSTTNDLVQQSKTISERNNDAEKEYVNLLWENTKELRKNQYSKVKYPGSMTNLASEMEAVLQKEAGKETENIKPEEIDSLYKAAYMTDPDQGTQTLPLYATLDLSSIPVSSLIEKRIVGLSDTPFADFVKKLGSLDWIGVGHKQFHDKAEGLCPYCRQKLPDDFEEQLTACYDEEYKKEIQALDSFISEYGQSVNILFKIMAQNLSIPFETELKKEYISKKELLLEKSRLNKAIFDEKKSAPGKELHLEDISDIILSINALTEQINSAIGEYNKMISDPKKQKRCRDMIISYFVQNNRTAITTRIALREKEKNEEEQLNDKIKSLNEEADKLQNRINELNKTTVNTTATKDSINALIENCGFRGFRLREKPDAQYVYELVRQSSDGRDTGIAKNLSEGERHFIAFLYFYHTVIGSQSDDGRRTSKIVVIDDPVSSMDSDTLFIVASLTRILISVCYNNFDLSEEEGRDDYIRQIFCLTHNPYFFREISYGWMGDYESVAFFEIKKHNGNRSTIEMKTGESKDFGGGKVNTSPVRNSYDSLWHEYCTTDDPETLMIVIRQILEYYFFQIKGEQSKNLRYELLDKHRNDFDIILENGTRSSLGYSLASAMIALLNIGESGFNDSLYFDSSAADVKQMRTICRRIFEVMHQEQHYDMMTNRQ